MSLSLLLGLLLLAVIGSHSANVIAIHYVNPVSPLWSSLKVAAYTLPLTGTCTFIYNYYYSQGSNLLNYFTLGLVAIGFSLAVGGLIQVFMLKARSWSPYEIVGIVFLAVGVLCLLIAKSRAG